MSANASTRLIPVDTGNSLFRCYCQGRWTGKLSQLDIEHLAEEIEDVGKSEKRELASRMTVLMAHILNMAHSPGWERAIREHHIITVLKSVKATKKQQKEPTQH